MLARKPFEEKLVCGQFVDQNPESSFFARHIIPKRTNSCQRCHALMWEGEELSSSTKYNKKYSLCCLNGAIDLPKTKPIPTEILELLTHNDKEAKEFRKSIRLYNNLLSFTSTSAKVDENLLKSLI